MKISFFNETGMICKHTVIGMGAAIYNHRIYHIPGDSSIEWVRRFFNRRIYHIAGDSITPLPDGALWTLMSITLLRTYESRFLGVVSEIYRPDSIPANIMFLTDHSQLSSAPGYQEKYAYILLK